ncbi:MAG: SDR family NAD(P)-dependent oxidoreductase, partial [Actinobacteria bacterium]|nr:SDR family NAD(P)-dependent oxidoreductase [Actinomycetota bacterium]
QVLASYPRIDVLLNNAGIFTEVYQETASGDELTLASNHLGGFLLTQLLLTRLQESKARVLFVSSDAHRQAMKVNWDDINGKDLWKGKERVPNAGFVQYNVSKLFVASAAIELAERTKGTGMTVNTLAPGALIPTGIYDDATGPIPILIKYFRPLLRQPEKAMITYVYLATSPEVEGASGWYWKDGRFVDASQLAQSQELRDQIWAWSMRQSGLSQGVSS